VSSSVKNENPGLVKELAPIFSSLPGANDKFRVVIVRFVERLREQIDAIEKARSDKAYDSLQYLGGWLRASAGSLGFHDFDEPALALENFAKERDDAQLSEVAQEIDDLGRRVFEAYSFCVAKSGVRAVAPVNVAAQRGDGLPCVVTSQMMEDERFRPLVEKYVKTLPKQLDSMEQAMSASDLQTVADLAHWLLGSAGTLGLHAFTEPASALQDLANAGQLNEAKSKVKIIRTLCGRINLNATHEVA
jgi:HPt (histidine-containing phosphotransfer) domain-containing protein